MDKDVVKIDQEARERFNQQVAQAYEKRMVREEVSAIIREQEFESGYRRPKIYVSGAEGYIAEREPMQHAIDGLVVKGHNVLITAGYKTGKTNLAYNLVKSYTDDLPFLGAYPVIPMDEDRTVVLLDFEQDETYAWNKLKRVGIDNPERMNMVTMVGSGMDLMTDAGRDEIVEMLIKMRCQILIIDPFGAAFRGEENSNTEVRAFTTRLNEIKAAVGVREMFMNTHTGRAQAEEGQERARGATVLNDWAGVAWTYTRDMTPGTRTPKGYRFLAAFGREVDFDEVAVTWGKDGEQLQLVEGGGRASQRDNSLRAEIIKFLKDNPGSSTNDVVAGVKGKRATICDALEAMSDAESSLLDVADGARKSKLWSVSAHYLVMLNRDQTEA